MALFTAFPGAGDHVNVHVGFGQAGLRRDSYGNAENNYRPVTFEKMMAVVHGPLLPHFIKASPPDYFQEQAAVLCSAPYQSRQRIVITFIALRQNDRPVA
jgi:hypothetical protein